VKSPVTRFSRVGTLAVSLVVVAACSRATQGPRLVGAPLPPSDPGVPSVTNPMIDGNRYPHTAADTYFMAGMIPHHAQAVLIAGWAKSHGARADIQRLCERIVVAQRDEIALIQQWLLDRAEPVPAADATHHRMTMDGMAHDMLMPGMLNEGELRALDRARGPEFDRLFLMAMIKHHEGAITMVDQLFATAGAAQDDIVFKFANDVSADQTTEIDFMQKMLAELMPGGA